MPPALAAARRRRSPARRMPAIKRAMSEARAAVVLVSDAPSSDKLAAIDARARARRPRCARRAAGRRRRPSDGERQGRGDRRASPRSTRRWPPGRLAQNVWYGISLGSVLLLAAIGLAITFGVMGVINMAHGEMVMLGAYTTFVVQEVIRTSRAGSVRLVAGHRAAARLPGRRRASASLIERGIIRFLYGRPLETLLATWGCRWSCSRRCARSSARPTARSATRPGCRARSSSASSTITWNRLWIIVFALVVFAALILLLRKTPLRPADARGHAEPAAWPRRWASARRGSTR